MSARPPRPSAQGPRSALGPSQQPCGSPRPRSPLLGSSSGQCPLSSGLGERRALWTSPADTQRSGRRPGWCTARGHFPEPRAARLPRRCRAAWRERRAWLTVSQTRLPLPRACGRSVSPGHLMGRPCCPQCLNHPSQSWPGGRLMMELHLNRGGGQLLVISRESPEPWRRKEEPCRGAFQEHPLPRELRDSAWEMRGLAPWPRAPPLAAATPRLPRGWRVAVVPPFPLPLALPSRLAQSRRRLLSR